MISSIQVIFFDLGDTLVHIRPEILQTVCDEIGRIRGTPLKPDEYLSAFHKECSNRITPLYMHSIKSVNTHEKELLYWKNFFESLLITLRVPFDKKGLIEWLAYICSNSQSFECFEDVHPVLAELKGKGFKLGLISNAFPSACNILEGLGLKQYFDYSLLSFESEYIKPEPEIYHFAVEKLEVEVSKTIFVDDRWPFVKAAMDVGMNAYLIERFFDRNQKFTTNSFVPRIYDLFELRDQILAAARKAEHTPSYSNTKGDEDDSSTILPANLFGIS